MTAKRWLTGYFVFSALIAALAFMSVHIVGWLILLGGPAGGLWTFAYSIPQILEGLKGEGLMLSVAAIGLWIASALLIYFGARSKWKPEYIAGLIIVWIPGSYINIMWFAVSMI